MIGIRECQDGEGGPGNPSTLEVGAGESEPRSASATDFEHCLSFLGPGLKHTNKKRGAVPQVLRRAEAKVQEGRGREMWLGRGTREWKMLCKETACYQEVPLMTHSPDTSGVC